MKISLKLFNSFQHPSKNVDRTYQIFIDNFLWGGAEIKTYSSTPSHIQFLATDSTMKFFNVSYVTIFESTTELKTWLLEKLNGVKLETSKFGKADYIKIVGRCNVDN